MELTNVRVERPVPDRARLVGEVRYDDSSSPPETYWFDVPERCAGDLSNTGDPWLICLAPLAATLGEPLRIALPVDRLLARNVRELMAIWAHWYPSLFEVPLELEAADLDAAPAARRTGAFFSGGVDSFFTILRNDEPGSRFLPADELILVGGFDFPLERADAFERHRERMREAARELGKEFVDVVTNLRETRLREANWADVWHGPALAAVGLALESRYRLLLIASTSPYRELEPWGSHPMTDALLSTRATIVIHDGAEFTRLDKVGYLSRSEVAQRWLHVCFREVSDQNCGRCRKCLLTMMALALFGALERCRTFPAGGPDLERVGRILFQNEAQRRGVRRTRALALSKGRSDIARAINHALRRSTLLAPVLAALNRLSKRRGFSTLTRGPRRFLRARVVR